MVSCKFSLKPIQSIKDDNQLHNIDLSDLREACKILRSIIRYHHVPLLTFPQLGSIYKIQFSYATIFDRLIHANSTNQNIVFCICEFVHQYAKALLDVYDLLVAATLLSSVVGWFVKLAYEPSKRDLQVIDLGLPENMYGYPTNSTVQYDFPF